MNAYDVVIVGGGPAGSTCARKTVEAGLRTVVIEEQTTFQKVCAGMMIGEGEALIDRLYPEMPESVYATPHLLSGPKVYMNDRLIINSKGIHRNYDRSRLDEWMIQHSGAEVLRGAHYLSFAYGGDGIITIQCQMPDNTITQIECKYLVSAQGYKTDIASILYPKEIEAIRRVDIKQCVLTGSMELSADAIYILMRNESFVNYMVPKDGVWIIGVGSVTDESVDTLMESYLEFLRSTFNFNGKVVAESKRQATDLWETPIYGEGNVMLIGETAGLWGRAGDGIWYGLESGELCGLAIAVAAQSGKAASDIYKEKVKDARITERVKLAHGNAIAIKKYHRDIDRNSLR